MKVYTRRPAWGHSKRALSVVAMGPLHLSHCHQGLYRGGARAPVPIKVLTSRRLYRVAASSCRAASPFRGPSPAHHLVPLSVLAEIKNFSWQAIGRALTGTILSAALTMNFPFTASAGSLSAELKSQEVIRETLHEAWGEHYCI